MEVTATMRPGPSRRGPVPHGLYHNIAWKWQRALCTSAPVCHDRIETYSLELGVRAADIEVARKFRWLFCDGSCIE